MHVYPVLRCRAFLLNDNGEGVQHPLLGLHGSRPQIHHLEMCVYFGAVKISVLCVVLFCEGGIVVMGVLSSTILFKYEYRVGHLFVLSWARV